MNKKEEITQEELSQILRAKSNVVLASERAEKAVAVAKIAELEAQNIILSVYNKYNLIMGSDVIKETGLIERQKVEDPKEEVETPKKEVVETKTRGRKPKVKEEK